VEQAIGQLANAWMLRRRRGLLYRVRDVDRAAAALICLGRWIHRIPTRQKHPSTLTDQLVDNAVSRVGPVATVTVVTGPIASVALAAPRVRPASARAR
jgi:hypothetical protein